MKRILFVTAFVPSRVAAGENFSRQLINDLARKNNVDIILFQYSKDEDYKIESNNVRVLKVFKNSKLIKLLNFMMFPFLFPLFVVRFNFYRLFVIKKVLKKSNYDLLFLDYSQTLLYGKFIRNIPIILNSHDIIAQRFSRIYNGILMPLCRISEKIILNNKRAVIFTHSEKDKALIYKYYSINASVTSVYLDDQVKKSIPASVENYFVFFANWFRPDNSKGLQWFITNVYPFLDSKMNFKVIGMGLSEELTSKLKKLQNTEILGFIENPYPVISNAKALISPLFSGAGIKVKIIESLACGTPCIGTDISFEGIADIYSNSLIKANSKEEFIYSLNGFEIFLETKLNLKSMFISTYQKNSLSNFINDMDIKKRSAV